MTLTSSIAERNSQRDIRHPGGQRDGPGIVEQQVDAPEAPHRLVEQVYHVGFLGYVAGNAREIAMAGAGFVQRRLPPPGQDHAPPGVGKGDPVARPIPLPPPVTTATCCILSLLPRQTY